MNTSDGPLREQKDCDIIYYLMTGRYLVKIGGVDVLDIYSKKTLRNDLMCFWYKYIPKDTYISYKAHGNHIHYTLIHIYSSRHHRGYISEIYILMY